jgi:hypothetical protein
MLLSFITDIWLKSIQGFSRYAQTCVDRLHDSGGPVVSQLENLCMWVYSIGDRYASHEIWSNSIGLFSRYLQKTHGELMDARTHGRTDART